MNPLTTAPPQRPASSGSETRDSWRAFTGPRRPEFTAPDLHETTTSRAVHVELINFLTSRTVRTMTAWGLAVLLTPVALTPALVVTAMILTGRWLIDLVEPTGIHGAAVRPHWRRELDFTVALLALFYVVPIPVATPSVLLFLATNLILQETWHRIPARTHQQSRRMIDAVPVHTTHVVIVGTGDNARAIADSILDEPTTATSVIGFLDFQDRGLWRYRDIPLIGQPTDLEEIVRLGQVDAVFFAMDAADFGRARPVLAQAEAMGVPVIALPELYQPQVARTLPAFMSGLAGFQYHTASVNRIALFLKLALDKLGAAFGLILLAPVFAAVAAAIKLDSRGPVFFRQVRVGLNGRPFRMLKFRSMYTDAEERRKQLLDQNEHSGPVFKMANDPRITPIGRIIRKFSLDELPQLVNILSGQMSLVGPRPPLPREVIEYEPWQRRKLSVKPGLTCLWQVNGRNTIDFEDWMRLDLEYIDNWSLLLDVKLIVRTIPAVIKGTGV